MKVQHGQSNWAQINIFAVILPIATGATIVAFMMPVYADSVVIIQQGTPINSPQPIDVPSGIYGGPILAPTILNPNIDGYSNQPLSVPSYIYGSPIPVPTHVDFGNNFNSRTGERYRAPNNAPSYIYGSPIPVPTHVDFGNNFDYRTGNRYRAPGKN